MKWHSNLVPSEVNEKTGSSAEGKWSDLHNKWFIWGGLEFKQWGLP